MEESFTKHLPFSLLAKNLKKTKFWSAIIKSFWDFFILILCYLLSREAEQRIKKSQNDLRIKLQNFKMVFHCAFRKPFKWGLVCHNKFCLFSLSTNDFFYERSNFLCGTLLWKGLETSIHTCGKFAFSSVIEQS